MSLKPSNRDSALQAWRQHVQARRGLWSLLEAQHEVVQRALEVLVDTLTQGGTIYWCGNGGSAAQAQHLSAELVGRYERERAGLSSVSLVTDVAALTAIANDMGFVEVFSRQLEALGRPGDSLVALSTSGNSPNVLAAARYAREQGMKVIAMTGHGGQLAQIADLALCVKADNVALVQEGHLALGHYLCGEVERRMKS